MAARLPILYAIILIAETAYLFQRYLSARPGSSDPISVWLGWGGIGAMVVMLVYSIARRSRGLRQFARLSYWLHFHIFMGFQGMILVLFHSSHLFFREAPISALNPGFLSFIAVLIVFFSGIFGRYMYAMLPRKIGGEQMLARDVEEELAAMPGDLPADVQALWGNAKGANGFLDLIRADMETRRSIRALSSMSITEDIRDLAERRLLLERRLISVKAAERIFRRWIIAHRPIAAIMYVLTAVHIILSYMFTPGL